uniref:Uncharacterized protein n=1 Tax=Arundo donax TaxID=35708 RepID=A0A0A9CAU8_ARUDO
MFPTITIFCKASGLAEFFCPLESVRAKRECH